jgi:hypothetical protein
MLSRILRYVLILGLLAQAVAKESPENEATMEFARLDLTDGRKLRKVVVKNYDAEKGRLLLVASGKAMTVSIDLVPEPFRTRLKDHAPKAGSSTSSMPAPRQPTQPSAPPTRPPPVVTRPAPAQDTEVQWEKHKSAALARARNFYRYEHKAGSDSIRVTAINFETDDPEAITGWEGRYRVQGRVLLEYFDSKGYSFNRTTDRFEVITEQKGRGSIKVIDFTRK